MSRRNSQPAWRAAVVTLVGTAFMYYCIYRQPLRDLTERLARFDTIDNAFILGSSIVTLPIVVLYEKIKPRRLLYGSVILYHAASAFCKVAPNMNAFFGGQFLAGASAVSVIYGAWKWISSKMIKAAMEVMPPAERGSSRSVQLISDSSNVA